MLTANNTAIAKNIIQNMINVFDVAVKLSPYKNASSEMIDGSFRFFTGSQYPFFNGVFCFSEMTQDPEKYFSEIVNFYSERNVPFIWWWQQSAPIPDEIKKILEAKKFTSAGTCSGVAAQVSHMRHVAVSENILVKEVESANDYKKLIQIVSEVFGFGEELQNDYYAMSNSYGPGKYFRHYLGYYNGIPSGVLTGYVDGETLGVYSAATLQGAQRNGLCTALVQRVISDARNLGCKMTVTQLMAPGMAAGLSENLGGNAYCEMLPFLWLPQ